MKQRIITGLIMAVILVPFLLLSSVFVFAIGALVMCMGATYEMIRMFNTYEKTQIKENEEPKTIGLIEQICIFAACFLVYISMTSMWGDHSIWTVGDVNIFGWYTNNISFINVISLLSLCILTMMVFFKKFDSIWVSRAFTIICYVALGLGSLTILRLFGRRFLVYLFLVTIATDIFAYVFGMNFGKHKMAPKISPKKSWEGAIGGTCVATVIGSVYAIFYDNIFGWVSNINAIGLYDENISGTLFQSFCNIDNKALEIIIIIIVTILSSVMGQIGDLVASKFKRDNKIKDYSNIFPGHGGILDRFDSSLFVALFLASVCNILGLIFPL